MNKKSLLVIGIVVLVAFGIYSYGGNVLFSSNDDTVFTNSYGDEKAIRDAFMGHLSYIGGVERLGWQEDCSNPLPPILPDPSLIGPPAPGDIPCNTYCERVKIVCDEKPGNAAYSFNPNNIPKCSFHVAPKMGSLLGGCGNVVPAGSLDELIDNIPLMGFDTSTSWCAVVHEGQHMKEIQTCTNSWKVCDDEKSAYEAQKDCLEAQIAKYCKSGSTQDSSMKDFCRTVNKILDWVKKMIKYFDCMCAPDTGSDGDDILSDCQECWRKAGLLEEDFEDVCQYYCKNCVYDPIVMCP
tara:strand:- start:832 stop:1716 length:885 start_codon:yes stop_codon:yes gene_type:complete